MKKSVAPFYVDTYGVCTHRPYKGLVQSEDLASNISRKTADIIYIPFVKNILANECAMCMVSVGVGAGGTPLVIRKCLNTLKPVTCTSESYGGALQCFCITDFCNEANPFKRTTGYGSVTTAEFITTLAAVCASSLMIQ